MRLAGSLSASHALCFRQDVVWINLFEESSEEPLTRRVTRGDVEISLSQKEFALLETLMLRPGRALSRLQLLEHAWDDTYENRSNVVDVYIRYLREKIDRPFGTDTIETVRGIGYRLRA